MQMQLDDALGPWPITTTTTGYPWPSKQDQGVESPTMFDFTEDDGVFMTPVHHHHPAQPQQFIYTDHVIDSPFLLDHNQTPSPTFAQIEPPSLTYHPTDPTHAPARPLMLAHRTSLPISIPNSPYRSQPFMQHSAPASFSPIRMVHTTPFVQSPTSPDGLDDGGRKRRRTPEPAAASPDGLGKSPPTKSELHPPKQAPSTWQVFFADWLEDHRARNPRQRLNVAQAAKEAGQVYHNLKPDQREKLKARAQSLKDERERELAEWKRKLTPDDIRKENAYRAAQRKAGKSRRGNLKDPNAPKKPLSAYFMFLQYIRANNSLVQDVFGDETETTKQSVLAAAKWRSLSDEDKKPFLVQAEQEKIEYETQRRLYEERTSGIAGTGATAYRATGDLPGGSTTSVLMNYGANMASPISASPDAISFGLNMAATSIDAFGSLPAGYGAGAFLSSTSAGLGAPGHINGSDDDSDGLSEQN